MKPVQGYLTTLALTTQALLVGSAHAAVDQENPPQPSYLSIQPNSDTSWQQEVVVGVAGRLSSVDLFFLNSAPWLGDELRFLFSINRGGGWQTDDADYSTVVSTSTFTTPILLASANLVFQIGDKFTIGIQRAPGGGTLCCSLLGTINTYSGDLWSKQGSTPQSIQADLAFRTYVGAVPDIPLWMALLAGMPLVMLRLKQHRNSLAPNNQVSAA